MAAETKEISVIGYYSVDSLNNIEIITKYHDFGFGNTIMAFIANVSGIIDSVSYIEGELFFVIAIPNSVFFTLDNQGNLIVTADDSTNYSINSNGDLIYTS